MAHRKPARRKLTEEVKAAARADIKKTFQQSPKARERTNTARKFFGLKPLPVIKRKE